MSESRTPILFLSGAGLPEWIWDDVRRELDPHCETRVAPRPEREGAGLREYAEAAIAAMDGDRCTLVAHSAGGMVGAEVARLAPGRVDGMLGLGAIVPKPGGSFISAMPIPNRWILGIAMRAAGTRPPASAIRGTLAHGLDGALVDRLIADFEPEPLSFYRDRTVQAAVTGRCGYLRTTRDRELPPKLQQRFERNLRASWSEELGTGHLPMLEDPASLARAILRFRSSGVA